MELPRPFDADFLADMPYDPAQTMLFDQLVELDQEESRVVCHWPTSPDEPITRAQRNHPVRHPAHVSGALMVHATGILGFVHAYYVLGLRHRDGWVGYGATMNRVAFRKLVPPGEVIVATCTATRVRKGKNRYFAKYAFRYEHDGDLAYESEQAAMWIDTTHLPADPTSAM